MKIDLFQSHGHCWVFQICWHILCSTFTASSFRILNISVGISSPLVALFIVMLYKACLTEVRLWWVTTPSWLSRSLRPFLYSFSVYSCHLFLVSSVSVRSLPFLSFTVPVLAWNVPLISPLFLKRSLVCSVLLFSSTSLHYFLRKPFYLSLLFSGTLYSVRYIFPFLLCISLLFFPQLFVKHLRQSLCLLAFLFLWDGFGHCFLYNVTNLCP